MSRIVRIDIDDEPLIVWEYGRARLDDIAGVTQTPCTVELHLRGGQSFTLHNSSDGSARRVYESVLQALGWWAYT